jgi:PAS domain S-box-containing protein
MKSRKKMREIRALDALIGAALFPDLGDEHVPVQMSTLPKIAPDLLEMVKDIKEDTVARMLSALGRKPANRPISQGKRLTASVVPSEAALKNLLISVKEGFGYDAGIVYLADYQEERLVCAAYLDSMALPVDGKQFSYSFKDESAATKIFHERQGFFSTDPWNDKAFNKKGLRAFRIDGPVIGVPLLVGARVVGVLVAWSRCGTVPSKKDIEGLRLQACFTASAVYELELREYHQKRKVALSTLQHRLPAQSSEFSSEEYLVQLLLAVREAGFERARVFRYERQTRSFQCVGSLGVTNRWTSTGVSIAAKSNPYAKHLEETFLQNPAARFYDPCNADYFGADPDAAAFDTPLDVPWVAVPLIAGGELFGMIVADNALSYQRIDRDGLEYLTVLSGLVGQGRHSKAIADLKAFYSSLAEVLEKCVLRKDLQGVITYANQAFADRLGKPISEIIGKTDGDLFPKATAKKFRHDDKRVVATGKPIDRIEESPRPQGGRSLVHVYKAPVRDSQNNIVGIQCVFWDVTQEHMVEEDLKRTKDDLRVMKQMLEDRTKEVHAISAEHSAVQHELGILQMLVQSTPLGLYMVTFGGKFQFVNKTFIDLLGYDDDQDLLRHIGRTGFSIFAVDRYRRKFLNMISTEGRIQDYCFSANRKDGSEIWVSATACRIEGVGEPVISGFIQRHPLCKSLETVKKSLTSAGYIEDGPPDFMADTTIKWKVRRDDSESVF